MTYAIPSAINGSLKDKTSAAKDTTCALGKIVGYEADNSIVRLLIDIETANAKTGGRRQQWVDFPAHPMQIQEFLDHDVIYVARKRVYNKMTFIDYRLIDRDGKRLETSAVQEVGDR